MKKITTRATARHYSFYIEDLDSNWWESYAPAGHPDRVWAKGEYGREGAAARAGANSSGGPLACSLRRIAQDGPIESGVAARAACRAPGFFGEVLTGPEARVWRARDSWTDANHHPRACGCGDRGRAGGGQFIHPDAAGDDV